MTAGRTPSSPPQSSKGSKRSIFRIFSGTSNSTDARRSRRNSSVASSATSSGDRSRDLNDEHDDDDDDDEDDTSEDDDRSIDLTSYNAAVAPLKFKPSMANTKQHTTDVQSRIHQMLDDEDYEKFLRQPKHIKTFRKANKTAPIAKRLFLAQELLHTQPIEDEPMSRMNTDTSTSSTSTTMVDAQESAKVKPAAIWAMKFSLDGKFLATAGKGNVIRVWKVISSPLDRLEFHRTEMVSAVDRRDATAVTLTDNTATGLDPAEDIDGVSNVGNTSANADGEGDGRSMMSYASVFQDEPYRTYRGHTHDILSLDWSKNNFLLSSSMDKTAKLWNIQQNACLRTFQHRDFVPSVKFHPTDDRFFVSGCLDHKVRLWSILENEVKFEFDAKNLVTAVAFTPNGKLTIAGTFNGTVYFLDTQNLELRQSVELNQKKKHENMKITGIESFVPEGEQDIKVLITSNDSRIRVISLRHKQLECYYKGLDNNSSQIIATVSHDQKYIISGSENHWVYIWEVDKFGQDKEENGTSHGLLGMINTSKKKKKKRGDYTSFHGHHHVITCALIAPSGTFKALALSNDYIYELNTELCQMKLDDLDHDCKTSKGCHAKKKRGRRKSQTHDSLIEDENIGGIIVTADDHGLIRVFRQDLPSSVRKIILNEKKRRDSTKVEPPDLSQLNNHRMSILSNTFNGSSGSIISRGNSLNRGNSFNRGNSLNRGNSSNAASPLQGRSRSVTAESITNRLHLARGQSTNSVVPQKKVTCEVCGGEKFVVSRVESGLEMLCTDCGNHMKPLGV